jgi:hypothetical protein
MLVFMKLLSRGNADVPVLVAEVTPAWEEAAIAEATHVAAALAAEASAQEATTVWDSAALRVKDVEDWAALAEREALEKVSRVEEENVVALACCMVGSGR